MAPAGQSAEDRREWKLKYTLNAEIYFPEL